MKARGKFMWALMVFLISSLFIIPWMAALYYSALFLQIDVSLPENQGNYGWAIIAFPIILCLVYLRLGLGQTFFDVWDEETWQTSGELCMACYGRGKAGKHYNKTYLCDACIHKHYKDMRFTAAPVAILVGLGLVFLGIFSILNPQAAGPSVTSTITGNETSITTTTTTISSPADDFKPIFSVVFGIFMTLIGLGTLGFGANWLRRLFNPLDDAMKEKMAASVMRTKQYFD